MPVPHCFHVLIQAFLQEGNNDWEMICLLSLFDPPRHDTKQTIEECLKKGILVKMVTGGEKSTSTIFNYVLEIWPHNHSWSLYTYRKSSVFCYHFKPVKVCCLTLAQYLWQPSDEQQFKMSRFISTVASITKKKDTNNNKYKKHQYIAWQSTHDILSGPHWDNAWSCSLDAFMDVLSICR